MTPTVSFEFFPPKTATADEVLWETVQKLATLNPAFVSFTFGAVGSVQNSKTFNWVKRIRQETVLEPAAHMTCVDTPKTAIDELAQQYWDAGIRHIVALRGDVPQHAEIGYQPHPEGYGYAADLVAGLKKIADFEISQSSW